MSRILTIKDLFAPGFYRAWNDFYTESCETLCLDGGRGSCKSTTADTFMLLGMERDRRIAYAARDSGDKDWRRLLTHGACYRKVAGTLADSCFSQLQWSADKLGIYDKFIWRKTPLSVVRKGSNQRVVFRGLDDAQKSRSIKMPFGYLKYLHWEELTEFAGLEEVQDVTRSVQRGGHKFMTFYTYNPPETSANWVNFALAKLEEEDPLFRRYHTDYRSVPPEWLGEKFFRDAEILRRLDERQYRHVYLGEITGNGGTVFPRVKAVEFSDRDIARFENVRWGADFGLRDPTTLIGLNYDKGGQRVQIFSEWYKTDATLDEIEEGFKRNHFGYEYIYGDYAAGTLITTLRAHGLPMLPSEKGKGSILNGIKGLQSMVAIEIDKRRCPHTYWEFVHMEYEKDKAGGFTGNIPPGNDHCVDPCVTGDTLVQTTSGVRRIDELVGTTGRLLAYDESDWTVRSADYCHCRKTLSDAPIDELMIDGGITLHCTADHRILTPDGYVRAYDLHTGSPVVTWQGVRKVESKRYQGSADVYDLEVPKYHNFIVNRGLVIHNCRYALAKDLENFSPFG